MGYQRRTTALLTIVREVLGGIGAGIVTVSALYYLLDVLRGGTRPQRTSWGVWAIVGILGVTSADAGGAGPGAWSSAVDAVACAITFVISLHPRFGKPGGRRSDLVLFAVACAGIVLWRDGTLSAAQAAVCAVVIDTVALWPTMREAWRHPELESRLSWGADCVGHVLCLAAIAQTSVAALAFPAYTLAATALVTAILVARRPSLSVGAEADRRTFPGRVGSSEGPGVRGLRPLSGGADRSSLQQ